MKQHLRSLWTLLLLMMWCSVGFAQEVTLDFTKANADWGIPTENITTAAKYTNGTYTISFSACTTGHKELNDGGVIMGKKDASLTLPAFDFDVEKIIVRGKSGASKNVTENIFVGSKAVSSPKTNAQKDLTFNIDDAYQAKGNVYILKVTNKNNTQFTKIEIYKKASSKTPTKLTFPKSIFNIEEGNEATFTGQTATLKAGGTVLNNAITYTTNNDAMFEKYDAKVGPKALKASAYGTATVTAKFNGDDTYEASTATYTVNYTEKEKPATTLDFGFATKTANINETFTATATLKAGETAISGAVTYTSSNHKVATVNETTGEVSALTAGITTIKATFAGTSEYKSSTASYDLTVVDPNAPLENIVFDAATKGFDDMIGDSRYPSGTKNAAFKTKDGKTYAFSYSNCMRYTNKGSNPDVIQMKSKSDGKGSFTSPVFDEMPNGYKVNVYYGINDNNTPLTITSNEETSATSISNAYGDENKTDGTGYCTSIILSNGSSFTVKVGGSTCYVSKIEILPISAPITLEENATDTDTKIAKNNGKTQDVALTRTLVANKWNTFCVPFETELAGTALEGATVKAVGTIEGNVINLVDADKIEAGVPYLVMPTTESIVNPTFKGVTISVTTPVGKGNDEYKFVGTYSPKKITVDEFGKIWGITAQGKLAKINADTTMKGLRAYFVFPTNTAAAKLNFDGETTGINNIETNATVNGKVYNLNGQYVGNSLNGLKKGIYVVNGKKVIK